MNYLMKLVKTALEWSYEAKSTDVLIEMLEKAATLLVLRRNTLWIIDGVGPSVKADPASRAEPVKMGEKQAEQASSPNEEQKIPPIPSTEQVVGTPSQRKAVDARRRIGHLHVFWGRAYRYQAFSREWCLAGGVSWLRKSMDSFARWWSAALQIAQETENERSQYRATMGQGKRRNGLGCDRGVKRSTC